MRHRVAALLVGAIATLGATPPCATADEFAEREQRLKTLGVDDELRPRIHRAIGVGSHWLVGRIAPSVPAGPKSKPPAFLDPGPRILATLALAHSRTTESVAAAKASVRRLLVDDTAAWTTIRSNTYMGGIAGLIAADPDMDVPPSVARELSLRIASSQGAHGWWGYSLGGTLGTTAKARGVVDNAAWMGASNLSTTQFAVLGAFGLRRAGAPVPLEVWERHLRGLCDLQTADGSWTYNATKAQAGYPNGTYMGIAGLLAAEDALAGRLRDPADLRDLKRTKERGLAALRREVGQFIVSARSMLKKPQGRLARVAGASVDGYGMYALEKACIFAGLEKVDGESWYEAGARHLVAAQRDDGSWNGDPNTTSFALLFLSRSPERYRPTVVTVSEPPPRPTTVTEPATKPPPATTPTAK